MNMHDHTGTVYTHTHNVKVKEIQYCVLRHLQQILTFPNRASNLIWHTTCYMRTSCQNVTLTLRVK